MMGPKIRSPFVRFWAMVDVRGPDDCWEWQGSVNPKTGYGALGLPPQKAIGTHVFSWILANAVEVPEGEMVLHSCDNRPCVNPAHLRSGTHADNMRDMVDRSRNSGPRPRPHRQDDEEIRRLYLAGLSSREVAARMGCDQKTVLTSLKRTFTPSRRPGRRRVRGVSASP